MALWRSSSGPFAASVFAYGVNSDGYRVNSALRERTAIGDLRYTGKQGVRPGRLFLVTTSISVSPCARLVDQGGGDQRNWVTDRRGATTPTAFVEKTGGGRSPRRVAQHLTIALN